MTKCILGLSLVLALLLFAACGEEAPMPTPLPAAYSIERLTAESALLIDADTGDVLYSKNSRVRMYPASTTKIMTLLLALESDIALDARVSIPDEAGNVPDKSSVVPVYPGDEMTWQDLLCGFMLNSGNDGANAIAVLAAGSLSAFVDRMNARAEALGCEGTHFVNAHGYHDSEHYTTAQDLALISMEAMKNAEFRRIVAEPHWEMNIVRRGKNVVQDIESRVTLVVPGQKYYYAYCTGIKTGHTHKAGYCFVGSASRDGVNLICVVLNCPGEMDKWYDAARLWEHGFAQYEAYTLQDILSMAAPRLTSVRIGSAAPDDPFGGALALNMGEMTLSGEGVRRINTQKDGALDAAVAQAAGEARIEWNRALEAPIQAGETLGTLTWTAAEGSVSAPLIASRDVEAARIPEPVVEAPKSETRMPYYVFGGALLILMLALAALELRRRARKKRRARRGAAVKRRRGNGAVHERPTRRPR